MTNRLVFFLMCLAAALAGCASDPDYTRTAGPYVRPGLVIVPADQIKYYQGRSEGAENQPPGWSKTKVGSVQTDSEVTAIQFNRYPDPNDKNLMHEAHVVYRRDNQPQWKLQSSSGDGQILVGPQMTEGRGELKPVQSQELESYLREQKTSLARQQQVMAKVAEGMRELAEQQQSLAREIAEVKAAGEQTRAIPGKTPSLDPSASSSPGSNQGSDSATKLEKKSS